MCPADPQAWLAADDAQRRAWAACLDDGAQALAIGWAVHAAARMAWSREPLALGRGAHAVRQLAQRFANSAELSALRAWMDGQSALVEGRMADARDALGEASRAFAVLGDEPHAAQALVPQLMALSMLGEHDQAAALARDLVDRFARQGDLAAAGRTELNLGSLLMRQDRYAASADAYRAAAARFSQVEDRQHMVMADVGLALALTWQCAFEEADHILQRASQRARAHDLPALQALAETNRGRLELLRGRHAQALGLLESARQLALAGGTAPQRLEVERHLADAYLSLQLLPEALAVYEGLLRSADAGTAVEQGWIELRCAEVQLRREAPRAAATHLARAQVALSGNAVGSAACSLLAARLAMNEGDLATAKPLVAQARAGFEVARARPWALQAGVLEARIGVACGQADDALTLLNALWPALPAAATAEVQAEAWLVRAEARARLSLPNAHRDAEAALARLEQEQATLPADEFRVAHGALHTRAHEAWLGLLSSSQPAPTPAEWLHALERGRGSALALALNDAAEGAHAAAAQAGDTWRWLHREWQSALSAGREEEASRLLGRLRQAEAAWQTDRRREAAGVTGPAAAPLAIAWDVTMLHATLGPDRALVAYHRQATHLMACVVKGGQIQVLRWQVNDLDERIAGTRFQMETLRAGTQVLGVHAAAQLARTQQRLHDLGQCLWAPVAQAVGTATEVVLLLHGSMHGVPFAALSDDAGRLLERHAFVVAPSIAQWLRHTGQVAARAATPAGSAALLVGYGGANLPEIDREIHQIAGCWGAGADVFTGAQATLATVRGAAPQAEWLHLACHGHFRSDNPVFSALHLADGALSLHEVSGWRLRARLVTLSACETGMGRLRAGQELIGLVRGFLIAGAASVLASQWQVADEATAELMGHFYRALRDGERPARALQQAQLAVARVRPHPYHWAAFGLYGTG